MLSQKRKKIMWRKSSTKLTQLKHLVVFLCLFLNFFHMGHSLVRAIAASDSTLSPRWLIHKKVKLKKTGASKKEPAFGPTQIHSRQMCVFTYV